MDDSKTRRYRIAETLLNNMVKPHSFAVVYGANRNDKLKLKVLMAFQGSSGPTMMDITPSVALMIRARSADNSWITVGGGGYNKAQHVIEQLMCELKSYASGDALTVVQATLDRGHIEAFT